MPPSSLPLVSVLIPVYNYGFFVAETVESIWNQDYGRIEIIAIDDGSTDDSFEKLKELEARSPLPMTVMQTKHLGVSGVMNMALRSAQGTFSSVVHADDVHLPEKIGLQAEALLSNPKATLCHTEYRCVDTKGTDLGFGSRDSDLPAAKGSCLFEILKLKADVRSVSMLYRTDSLRDFGGYDPSLPYEDWQSILRLAALGEVAHIDEDLVLRRIHEHNRHINVTKFPEFNIDQIAPKVLLEVCPEGMDPQQLFVNHIGTLIASSVGSGNLAKGVSATLYTCRKYGLRHSPFVAWKFLRGLIALAWLRWIMELAPRRVTNVARRAGKAISSAANSAWFRKVL